VSLKPAAVDTAARKDSRPFSLPNNVGLQDLTLLPFLRCDERQWNWSERLWWRGAQTSF
jgi:hypothetical protein